ncbi:hypothetical protein [Streptomyces sp. WG-D5]
MADKTPAQLDKEIQALRASIKSAAFTSTKGDLATQQWVEKETAPKIWENHKKEIIGLAAGFVLAKLELPSLFSLEPIVERLLAKKNIERGKHGFLLPVKRAERERRQRVIDEAEARLARMERGLGRLQDLVTNAHQKVGNSNRRINALERRVSSMSRASGRTREQVRASASPNLSGSTTQLQRLEARVNALTVALG